MGLKGKSRNKHLVQWQKSFPKRFRALIWRFKKSIKRSE